MSTFFELWSRAAAWRWVLTATLFVTGISWLLTARQVPATTGLAKYTPAQSHTPNLTALGGQPLTGTSSVPVAGRSPSSSYRHDSNFDGQLVSAVQTGSTLPLNTELHVIGVYEASDSTKGADKQKCMVFREDPQALFECHAQVNHRMNPIAVNVPSSANPIALVLMAYEPVQWRITSSATSNIQKVIISGYHGQDVEGLAPTIPVVSYTHEISPCKTCQRQAGYFYAYDENSKEFPTAIKKITAITGLTLNSFQGGYKGERFHIRAGATYAKSSELAKLKDTYSGRSFTDNLKVADTEVALPEGKWEVISYFNKPSGRGFDQTLLLALAGKTPAESYFAIRVKTPGDQSGFLANEGCKRKTDYVNETLTNTAFGKQACYWVGPVSDAWSQPLFATVKTHSAGNLPDLVIASSFHQANERGSVSTLLYALPNVKLSQSLPRGAQDWEPQNLAMNPAAHAFADQQMQWAKVWFQMMSATQ